MSLLVRIGSQTYKHYNDLLERSPLSTKSVTSGVMYAGGDAIAQYVEHRKTNENRDSKDKASFIINKKRLVAFFIYGTCVAGPVFHYWFNYLNELPQVLWRLKQSRQRGNILRAYAYLRSHNIEVKLDMSKLPVAAPLPKWKSKAYKIAADQLIFSSLYTLAFFMGIGTLSGALDRLELWYEEFNLTSTLKSKERDVIIGGATAAKEILPVPATSSKDKSDSSPVVYQNDYEALIVRLKSFLQEQEDHFYGKSKQNSSSDDDEVSTAEPTVPELNNGSRDGMTAEQIRLLEEVLERLKAEHRIMEQKLSWYSIWSNTWKHTRDVYLQTYIADCMVWPPLQLINFTFVPVRFQFLFVNVASLAWNTFLSLMANTKHDAVEHKTSEESTNSKSS